MMKMLGLSLILVLFLAFSVAAQKYETDVFDTSAGPLKITFLGHGSLLFGFGDKTIYLDPVMEWADFSQFPKANLILLTHEHKDHKDTKALELLRNERTVLVGSESCAKDVEALKIMHNGERLTSQGIGIEAVPAYNIVHMRSPGQPFHPKGSGNGYVITFGDKRVYVAGDTENIPEMKELKAIDVAFLPMNLPYTMTPEMAADAAKSFKPKILYPYHFGTSDTARIVELLKGDKGIEVRIRKLN
jgi:L-ascorbate metabolism protein UlaG (beta-lactamase superfamily)